MRTKNRRMSRVGDLIRAALSEVLQRGLADPRVTSGLVTITDVDVSPDLRHAIVWVSVIGDEEAQDKALAGLKAAANYLRRELGGRIATKYTPALRFQQDRSAERGARMERTLAGLDFEREEE